MLVINIKITKYLTFYRYNCVKKLRYIFRHENQSVICDDISGKNKHPIVTGISRLLQLAVGPTMAIPPPSQPLISSRPYLYHDRPFFHSRARCRASSNFLPSIIFIAIPAIFFPIAVSDEEMSIDGRGQREKEKRWLVARRLSIYSH